MGKVPLTSAPSPLEAVLKEPGRGLGRISLSGCLDSQVNVTKGRKRLDPPAKLWGTGHHGDTLRDAAVPARVTEPGAPDTAAPGCVWASALFG